MQLRSKEARESEITIHEMQHQHNEKVKGLRKALQVSEPNQL